MDCSFKKYTLHFKKPGGTSRGILYDKETYIISLEENGLTAFGECNLFKGLSADDRENYEEKLAEVCQRLQKERENILPELISWPSLYFGVETLLHDLNNGCRQIIFPKAFSQNTFTIPTNGLIWMGSRESMLKQIDAKLESGYRCIKLKIGAIDFRQELELVQYIRNRVDAHQVELRLDANGAFSPEKALKKLRVLADYDIRYIEQPIKAGQWKAMASLIKESPIPIALDEELIGIYSLDQKKQLMEKLKPEVLILKPALLGGFAACDEWKNLLATFGNGINVVTSALESNIGLNAIAQYVAADPSELAQGLGTGQLYNNNIPAPYDLDANGLHYNPSKKWDFSLCR